MKSKFKQNECNNFSILSNDIAKHLSHQTQPWMKYLLISSLWVNLQSLRMLVICMKKYFLSELFIYQIFAVARFFESHK